MIDRGTHEPGLRIRARLDAGVRTLWVEVSGELDLSTEGRLETAIRPMLVGAKLVHVDLGGVTFLDSTGVHDLSELRDTLGRMPVELVIDPGRDRVRRVFRLAGVEDRFLFASGEASGSVAGGGSDHAPDGDAFDG